MSEILVLAAFAAALSIDFRPKIKAGERKVCWIYGILMVISFVILFWASMGIMLPSPLQPLKTFMANLLQLQSYNE